MYASSHFFLGFAVSAMKPPIDHRAVCGHQRAKARLAFAQGLLGAAAGGDVEQGNDHTLGRPVRPIRQDAHQVPAAGVARDLALDPLAPREHGLRVRLQIRIRKAIGEIRQRPAAVALAQPEERRGLRRVTDDAERPVEEQGGGSGPPRGSAADRH
jgi:hypothetical protein